PKEKVDVPVNPLQKRVDGIRNSREAGRVIVNSDAVSGWFTEDALRGGSIDFRARKSGSEH
ncbi:MAG TPA: hypothetical protein VNN75_05015, partial [Stellaceae bacterium]|nr:hypothetical protein [Stellaceae bacterium]